MSLSFAILCLAILKVANLSNLVPTFLPYNVVVFPTCHLVVPFVVAPRAIFDVRVGSTP